MLRSRWTLALVVPWLNGCFSGNVPPTTVLLCEATSDCPAGLACATEVGRCVPADVLASPGPVLEGDAVIEPALARADVEVRVAFTVDQQLAFDPIITVEGTTFTFAVVADESDAIAGSYVAKAVIGAGAPPEGSGAVIAEVTSVTGKPGVLRLGTLVVDRTANRTDGAVDFDAVALAPGGTVSLSFAVLEPVDDAHPPRVFFTSSFVVSVDGGEGEGEGGGGSGIVELEPWINVSSDGTFFSFDYTLLDEDPLALDEGFYEVRAVLLDNAGNESEPLFVGAVVVDDTPPSVVEASVVIAPAPESAAALLNVPVTAAGEGARVTVAFTADEEIVAFVGAVEGPGAPFPFDGTAVTLVCPAGDPVPLSRDPVETSTRFFTYELVVDAVTPEGDCELRADLVDLAGNAADVLLAPVTVDITAPSPIVDAAGAGAVLARAPWGATDLDDDGATDRGTLVLVTSTNEPGAIAVAIDPGSDGVLARAAFASTGAQLDLGLLDRKNVDIVAVDRAGNIGPRTRVVEGLWVATLGGKEPGSLVENPHRGVAHRALPLALDDADSAEIGLELAGIDGAVVTAETAARWRRGPDGVSSDLPRQVPAVAWDDALGVAVAFGGSEQGIPSDDTFQWNGITWTRLSLAARPPPRSGAAMAYDRRRGAMVLFGGTGSSGEPLDDTWELDGVWREIDVAGPPGRGETQAAYDPILGEVVVFGGRASGVLLADTWTFDGTSWTEIASAGPAPRARGGMTFDESRGVVVLCGGLMSGGVLDDDLWAFDGASWSVVPLSGAPPSVDNFLVHEHRMVFDPVRQAPVIVAMNAQQEFEIFLSAAGPTSWTTINELPTTRKDAVLFADPLRKELVIAAGSFDDTQVLGQGARAFASPKDAPGVRNRMGATFDPRTGSVILMAGRNASGLRQQDTWTFDGRRFRRIDAASLPATDDMTVAAPSVDALAFGGIVNAVGFVNQLRRFNGTSWVNVTASGTLPQARGEGAMAVEPGTTNVILFGGNSANASNPLGDTFRLTGTTWSSLGIAGPSPRFGHAMTVDRNRNGIVLYGGDDDITAGLEDNLATVPFGDTWLFAGGVWTDISAAVGVGPGPRTNHQMATDPITGAPLLFSGRKEGTARDNVLWELGPSGWAVVDVGPAPAPTDQAVLVEDTTRRHVVLFGGTGRDESFVLDRAPGGRPAVAFYADLVPLGLAGTVVESIEVSAVATGTGFNPDVGAIGGAELFVWSAGRWESLVSHASTSAAPLESGALDPFDVLFRKKTVNVAVVSPGQNGANEATVDVDHVEVRVAYRVTQ